MAGRFCCCSSQRTCCTQDSKFGRDAGGLQWGVVVSWCQQQGCRLILPAASSRILPTILYSVLSGPMPDWSQQLCSQELAADSVHRKHVFYRSIDTWVLQTPHRSWRMRAWGGAATRCGPRGWSCRTRTTGTTPPPAKPPGRCRSRCASTVCALVQRNASLQSLSCRTRPTDTTQPLTNPPESCRGR